ncbi:TlpA disulfide reductase family protein [Mucilaginibacter puniceus]
MKIIYYLSLLFIALGFLACNKRGSNPQRTVIDGRIANVHLFPQTKEFTLYVQNFGGDTSKYTGAIKKDGTFKIYFDQYVAQDVELMPIVRTLIAHPGDSIHIDIDYADMGTVKFSGDAEKTNNDLYHYLGENYSFYENELEYRKASKSFFETNDVKSHLDQSNAIKKAMIEKRQEFINKFNANSEVKIWTNNYININYYDSHLSFVKALARKNKRTINDITQTKGLDNLEKDLENIYQASTLNTGSIKLALALAPLTKSRNFEDFVNSTINARYDTLIKQIQIAYSYNVMLWKYDIDAVNTNKSLLDKHITEPFITKPLETRYAALKKQIDNAQALSNTLLGNVAKTPAKVLIDSIRKENLGKVVLIDVWATWCGPCISEFPDSKKLMESYKGKDVKFVFLCTGVNKVLWNDHIGKLNLAQHYYLNNEQSEALAKAFNISGIPFKILINKNGDIIETGNGLRANDELTAKKLDKLLVGDRLAANMR